MRRRTQKKKTGDEIELIKRILRPRNRTGDRKETREHKTKKNRIEWILLSSSNLRMMVSM